MNINLVSDFPGHIWARQDLVRRSDFKFTYSYDPVPADWWVIFDTSRRLKLPHKTEKVIFFPAEPPEIVSYWSADLRGVPWLASPMFPQLTRFEHWNYATCYWPWLVGLDTSTANLKEVMSVNEILRLRFLRRRGISLLVSTKGVTEMQRWRLEVVRRLAEQASEVHMFEGPVRLSDKFTALGRYRLTIAIENSLHRGYLTEKLLDPIVSGSAVLYSGGDDLPPPLSRFVRWVRPFDTNALLEQVSNSLESPLHLPNSLPVEDLSKFTLQSQAIAIITDLQRGERYAQREGISNFQVRRHWIRAHLQKLTTVVSPRTNV